MKIIMEQHAGEGHEYMHGAKNMWNGVKNFIDANQKQVQLTKKNKGIWNAHIEESETKFTDLTKLMKEIRDKL